MNVAIRHPREREAFEMGQKLFNFRGGPHDFACATCHAEKPSQPGFAAPPNGVLLGDGTVLPLPPVHKAKIGEKVAYGIRPEHFTFGSGVPAKVVVVEPTGPEMHIYADMGGQEICAITQERVSLSRDEIVDLRPRLDKVHLFDAESGTM